MPEQQTNLRTIKPNVAPIRRLPLKAPQSQFQCIYILNVLLLLYRFEKCFYLGTTTVITTSSAPTLVTSMAAACYAMGRNFAKHAQLQANGWATASKPENM